MAEILTGNRVKKIRFLESQMRTAVREMIKTETNPTIKTAYEQVLTNLEKVPINFYHGNSLLRTVIKIGKHFISSEILGEHKQNLKVVREGNLLKVIPEGHLIEMPADLFFHGDKVSWKGLQTLIHEMCHNPMRNVFEFSKEVHLTPNQTEELIADLLSARIAVKMGFPRNRIHELYHGRQGIYGIGFPFEKMIEKATTLKKRKGPSEMKWEAPRKIKREKKGRQVPLHRRRVPVA